MATKKKQSDMLTTAAEAIGSTLGTLVSGVRSPATKAEAKINTVKRVVSKTVKKKALTKKSPAKKKVSAGKAPAKKKAPARKVSAQKKSAPKKTTKKKSK